VLYATARDDAGNVSVCSAVPLSYINDSSPPETPALTHTAPASPSTTSTTPTVYGEAEAFITVNLYIVDGCILDPIATTTADGDGDFSFVVTVPDNAVTVFYASSVDEIGNISQCSEGLEFLHDDKIPDAPLLIGTDPESPGQDPTPEVLGESEAEILVALFTTSGCSGDPIGEGLSDEIGTFAVEASTSNDNATITYYAHVVDGAGNTSPCSEGLAYIHDTIAPEAPILLETLPESPGSHKSPGFVGTAEANALVKLYDELDCSGQQTGKGDADAGGDFTIQANVKANQLTTTHGTAADAAGNISLCGDGLDYSHDDKAPNKPIILGTEPESPNNQSTNPTVFGTAEPGCTLALLTDLNCFLDPVATTVTDEEGNWSLVVSVEANTQTPLRAYCTDDSDNQSECSSEHYYIHDDIPPEFDGVDNVVAVDEDTMVASWLPASDNFTLPFNMVYEVCVTTECGGCDDENFTPTYEMMPGTLQVTVDELLPDTRYYYAVRARDEAGNLDENDKDIAIKTPGAKMATGIAVGESQTCALLSDGQLACWGDETVPDLDEPPLAIGMGLNHSCAVLRNGQMRCWGANTSGQLGNGNTNNSAVPVTVSEVADAVRVSVGVAHTCAVMSDSRVQCWGQNQHGQLGDGTEELHAKPTNVYMSNGVLLTGAVDVACGWNHTCAAMADGTVKCWGLNVLGQLGDGAFTSSPFPIDALVSGSVRQVVAGEGHTCGLRVDGDVSCWGWNEFGQLGNGANDINPTPASVGVYDVRQLGGGAWHVCATLTDGSGQCWGRNESGQLGNGNAINANVPQLVTGLTDTIAIGAGSNHSCGLLSDGSVRCWGANLGGELGNGSTGTSLVPVLVTAISGVSHLTHVSRVSEHGCARVSDGSLRCWGKNSSGQVGDGEATLNGEVTIVETPATVMVTTGEFNSCALIDNGTVRCWGANTSGTVGNGQTSAPVKLPATVSNLDGVINVSLGRLHACALTASGGIYCWGANESGQLGLGDLDDRHTPAEVDMDAAVSIAAGDRHTCAVMATGDVQCWGLNEHGQLGTGDFASTVWPEAVLSVDLVVDVVAGKDHTCALRSNGTIRCWGANGKGQLGDGTTVDKPQQTPVPALNQVIDISAGLAHTCVTVVDGTASCWGSNGSAELGDPGAGTFSASPVAVIELLSDVRTIEAGTYSTCALGYDGLVQCWGYNNNAHLGTGQLLLVESPTLVDCLP
jgi:alpha-tubulin suppressor-like RCC1 family protein